MFVAVGGQPLLVEPSPTIPSTHPLPTRDTPPSTSHISEHLLGRSAERVYLAP